VIVLALDGRAFPLADLQGHLVDDDPIPLVGGNRLFQLVPRVPAGVLDQFGVASHLAPARVAACLAAGARVVMPRAEGDTEDQRGGNPAGLQQPALPTDVGHSSGTSCLRQEHGPEAADVPRDGRRPFPRKVV
jgi:hypothetical protein